MLEILHINIQPDISFTPLWVSFFYVLRFFAQIIWHGESIEMVLAQIRIDKKWLTFLKYILWSPSWIADSPKLGIKMDSTVNRRHFDDTCFSTVILHGTVNNPHPICIWNNALTCKVLHICKHMWVISKFWWYLENDTNLNNINTLFFFVSSAHIAITI